MGHSSSARSTVEKDNHAGPLPLFRLWDIREYLCILSTLPVESGPILDSRRAGIDCKYKMTKGDIPGMASKAGSA